MEKLLQPWIEIHREPATPPFDLDRPMQLAIGALVLIGLLLGTSWLMSRLAVQLRQRGQVAERMRSNGHSHHAMLSRASIWSAVNLGLTSRAGFPATMW